MHHPHGLICMNFIPNFFKDTTFHNPRRYICIFFIKYFPNENIEGMCSLCKRAFIFVCTWINVCAWSYFNWFLIPQHTHKKKKNIFYLFIRDEIRELECMRNYHCTWFEEINLTGLTFYSQCKYIITFKIYDTVRYIFEF